MPFVLLSVGGQGDVGISNYGDLKQQVAEWLNRTDLDQAIPEFIRLAESRIRTDLRVRAQEMIDTGTLTGDTLAVPSKLLDTRRLVVADRELAFITPEQYARMQRKHVRSPARYYTTIGETFHILGANSGDDYTLTYWEWFDYFVDNDDTNWLLLNSPDVYLWASLEAGALYLKDYAASADFRGRYDAAVKRVQDREKEMRFSGGPFYVRADVGE